MGRKSVEIFALFAVICVALGSHENCEEKENECTEKLINTLFGDFTDGTEACREFRGVYECTQNFVRECLGEKELPAEVEEAMKELEIALGYKCHDDEGLQCLVDNYDYLQECVNDRTEDISQLMQLESVPDDMNPKFVKCHLYGLMSLCVMGRSMEKCGEDGLERAAGLLLDVPPSVQESCDSQDNSVEDDKKKRAPQ